MPTLAVATEAETYDRLAANFEKRSIDVVHLRTSQRTVDLTGDEPFDVSPSDSAPADSTIAGDADVDATTADVDVGFVFPPRDVEGSVADALLDVPWVNGRDAVQTSRNKAEVIARCAQADLPVPETVLVSNPVEEDALREAVDRIGPPVVIKPTSTTRGVGIAKVGDVDSAMGVADYLDLVHEFPATGDKSFLVQEFVPNARDVRITTIDGEYAGAVERSRSDGGWRHNVHRGAEATGIEAYHEWRVLAESVATLLDIDFLGVDLLVTEDRLLVSETNARPTIDAAEKYEPDFYERLTRAIVRTAAQGNAPDR